MNPTRCTHTTESPELELLRVGEASARAAGIVATATEGPEDIAMTVYERMHGRLDSIDDPVAYMRAGAHNEAMAAHRRRRALQPVEEAALDRMLGAQPAAREDPKLLLRLDQAADEVPQVPELRDLLLDPPAARGLDDQRDTLRRLQADPVLCVPEVAEPLSRRELELEQVTAAAQRVRPCVRTLVRELGSWLPELKPVQALAVLYALLGESELISSNTRRAWICALRADLPTAKFNRYVSSVLDSVPLRNHAEIAAAIRRVNGTRTTASSSSSSRKHALDALAKSDHPDSGEWALLLSCFLPREKGKAL